MAEKTFVGLINLRGKNRMPIVAGTPFLKSDLVEATFDALFTRGDIQDAGTPVQVTAAPRKGRRVTGPRDHTPSAAQKSKSATSNTRKAAENLSVDQKAEKVAIIKKLKDLGVSAKSNCRLDTLQEKLAAAEKVLAEKQKKASADKVWGNNPEDLKLVEFPHLAASYKEICVKYELPIETFDTKELLIEKLSSQFNQ